MFVLCAALEMVYLCPAFFLGTGSESRYLTFAYILALINNITDILYQNQRENIKVMFYLTHSLLPIPAYNVRGVIRVLSNDF